ncbi:MAG: hypothetical protein GX623_06520 [Clostridiales bacterium]|nr:hypothetical protein [Clostridiales bacterium]
MGLFGKKQRDSFGEWLSSATDKQLEDAYESRRKQWLKDGQCGTGEKTPEMQRINSEKSRRSTEKWKNDPRRNKDPNYRWTDANRWDKD